MNSMPKGGSSIILNGLFIDEVGKQSGSYFMAISVIQELLKIDKRYKLITTEKFEWAVGQSIIVPKFRKRYRFLFESFYRNVYRKSLWLHFDYFLPYQIPGSKKKNVTVIHDLLPLDIPSAVSVLKAKWFRHQVKRALMKSDSVITISEFCLKRFNAHFPALSNDIKVIANPINIERFSSLPDVENWNSEGDFFIAISAPWPHKNLRTLINAVEKTFNERRIPLLICGTRSNLFADLKETESYKFLGFQADVDLGRAISNAKLVIAPSLYEGFGMTVYEALAMGKFVLASNLEVYENLPNLIKVENPELSGSWESAITSFLDNPPEKQKLDISHLHPKNVAEKYNEIIQKTEKLHV